MLTKKQSAYLLDLTQFIQISAFFIYEKYHKFLSHKNLITVFCI